MMIQRKELRILQREARSFYLGKNIEMPTYQYPQKDEEKCKSYIKHIVAELDNREMITEELEEEYLDKYIATKFMLIRNQIAAQAVQHKRLLHPLAENMKVELRRLDDFIRVVENGCQKLNQEKHNISFEQNKGLFKSYIIYFQKRKIEEVIRKLYKIKEQAEISRKITQELYFSIEKIKTADSENLKQTFAQAKERKNGLMQYARNLREEIILRDLNKVTKKDEEELV